MKTEEKKTVTPETLKKLEIIAAKCEPCQKVANSPLRFKTSMYAENVQFKSLVYIEIMSIDGRLVLH